MKETALKQHFDTDQNLPEWQKKEKNLKTLIRKELLDDTKISDDNLDKALDVIFEVVPRGQLSLSLLAKENLPVNESIYEKQVLKNLIELYQTEKNNAKNEQEIKDIVTNAYQQQTSYQLSLITQANKTEGIELLKNRLTRLNLMKYFTKKYSNIQEFQNAIAPALRKLAVAHLQEKTSSTIEAGSSAIAIRARLAELQNEYKTEYLKNPNSSETRNLKDTLDEFKNILNGRPGDGEFANFTEQTLVADALGFNFGIICHQGANNPNRILVQTQNIEPQKKCDVVVINQYGGAHFNSVINGQMIQASGSNNNCAFNSMAIVILSIVNPALYEQYHPKVSGKDVTRVPLSAPSVRNNPNFLSQPKPAVTQKKLTTPLSASSTRTTPIPSANFLPLQQTSNNVVYPASKQYSVSTSHHNTLPNRHLNHSPEFYHRQATFTRHSSSLSQRPHCYTSPARRQVDRNNSTMNNDHRYNQYPLSSVQRQSSPYYSNSKNLTASIFRPHSPYSSSINRTITNNVPEKARKRLAELEQKSIERKKRKVDSDEQPESSFSLGSKNF